MAESFVATRDILGWNGERVLIGMTAPVAEWPQDYVAHLVAEGTLRIEEAVELVVPEEANVVDVAGEAVRPPQAGDAS